MEESAFLPIPPTQNRVPHLRRRRRLRWVLPHSLALIALTASAITAQPQQTALTLDKILDQLQQQLNEYRSTIPSFFCDEHVVSRVRRSGSAEDKTVTDATFRLKRRDPPSADARWNLEETRELRTVNKVPVRHGSAPLPGPVVVSGVFSNGVSVVSREMARCFDYTLRPPATFEGRPVLEIDFTFKPDHQNDKSCTGPNQSSGRATFDASTLHPLRIEMSVPDYEVYPGSRQFSLWRWRVDYAPVTFDNKPFWLPNRIRSRIDANDQLTIWNFDADYTNYHKLEVHSRILP